MQKPTNLKGREYLNSIPVPERLSHLVKDKRGYPIPYFIPQDPSSGMHDFKYMDPKKQMICAMGQICMICGQSLLPYEYWYITGPMGRKNQSCSDPAMHEECARYSLAVCPHMHFEKTERTSEETLNDKEVLILEKPMEVYLIHAASYRLRQQHQYLLSFFSDVQNTERYHYKDGILIQDPKFKP